ncbi:MAG: DUF6504 family protein [Armatimonadota bacterium]|nr:DUF6504 family protein [Armatimonadota bacterium]MDR5697545.1 DUF6504 family protein [Armatimonadota bacterium]
MRSALAPSQSVAAARRPDAAGPRDPYLHRLIYEPVEVRAEEGRPVEFVWRGRRYRIAEVLASPKWWRRRRRYVVRTDTAEVFVLVRERGSWLLAEELYPERAD